MELLDKIRSAPGSLGALAARTGPGCAFPKFTGEISNRMRYRGKECLIWSVNNYLGLANHPEVRATDAAAAAEYGLAAPMGTRLMAGETDELEGLEQQLADYAAKPDCYFLNFGYQGMISLLGALTDRRDVIVYDAQCHACIVDGIAMHPGRHYAYAHNDVEQLDTLLERATREAGANGAVLVVTEGVFSMSGDLGKLDEIVRLKQRHTFSLLVDDAHGFGVTGPTGRGTGEHFGVQDGIDVYFATFAKAAASIGAFVAAERDIVTHLRYSMRSQIFAKGLPMPVVIGNRKRVELLRAAHQARTRLWGIAGQLQAELRSRGLEIGATQSPITPVLLDLSTAEGVEFTERLVEEHSIFCTLVIYPIVPRGVVQLRLTPTALHTERDVEHTAEAIPKLYHAMRGER